MCECLPPRTAPDVCARNEVKRTCGGGNDWIEIDMFDMRVVGRALRSGS